MDLKDLAGVLAIVLSLSIPIAAVVGSCIVSIKNKLHETELRKAIIENHVDAESIKLLIEEKQPKSNRFTMLRWGCILVGGGLGACLRMMLPWLESFSPVTFGVFIAFGMGIGMLAAFIIENRMQKKENSALRNADGASQV